MEKIIKVDLNDNEIGEIEKTKAHTSPILHRAFSVFLYDGDKILLQKRAKNKYHSGGLYANSCCSHQRLNQEFFESVKKRVSFELGVNENLDYKELFTFTYLSKYNDNLYEYELDHVIVAPFDKSKKIMFNKEEIECVEWVSIDHIKKDLVTNPEKYATWFIICAPKVIDYLENICKVKI